MCTCTLYPRPYYFIVIILYILLIWHIKRGHSFSWYRHRFDTDSITCFQRHEGDDLPPISVGKIWVVKPVPIWLNLRWVRHCISTKLSVINFHHFSSLMKNIKKRHNFLDFDNFGTSHLIKIYDSLQLNEMK